MDDKASVITKIIDGDLHERISLYSTLKIGENKMDRFAAAEHFQNILTYAARVSSAL